MRAQLNIQLKKPVFCAWPVSTLRMYRSEALGVIL